jgi:hypothetical protein
VYTAVAQVGLNHFHCLRHTIIAYCIRHILPLLFDLRRLSLRAPLYLHCGTLIALYAIVPRSTPKPVSEMKRIMLKTMMAVPVFALASGRTKKPGI